MSRDEDEPPKKRATNVLDLAEARGRRGRSRQSAATAKALVLREDVPWYDELTLGADDAPVGSVGNAAMILSRDVRWERSLWWDALHREVRVVAGPLVDQAAARRDAVLDDAGITDARIWLERVYRCKCTTADVVAALASVARLDERDALLTYLDGLSWDGEPRVDRFADRYLGCPGPLQALYCRLWFVSAIARARMPGCKADHVLVLEGEQGTRKSTALSHLGGEFFTDSLPSMQQTDAPMYLRGCWIVEMAELDALGRADVERAKAFITRRVDHSRDPYAATLTHAPRRCVFAGTTNAREWQRDATGGRRWWPVRTGDVDADAVLRDRDQLWAEAQDLYRSGARWWIHEEGDRRAAARDVAERSVPDPWEPLVRTMLEPPTDPRGVAVSAVLRESGLPRERWGVSESLRVVRLFVRLGCRLMPDENGERRYAPANDIDTPT